MLFDLYWISADEQTSMLMGEDFTSPKECKEAIPEARREMRSQLGQGDDGNWIDAGTFYCHWKEN